MSTTLSREESRAPTILTMDPRSVDLAQPPERRPLYRRLLLVVLAIVLPIAAGLGWHRASDNPVWPLLRSSLNWCQLDESPVAPISPNGLYRAHVVHATCLGRFTETMVFLSPAADSWSLAEADPNRDVVEVAGRRTLDAVTWRDSAEHDSAQPVLELWFVPGALPRQLHHMEPLWRTVAIAISHSRPAPGAERFDY